MASELKLSSEGAAFIAGFEGFMPTAYTCPAGKRTIGYGHVIQPGEYFEAVSQEQAKVLLQRDAEREAAPVARHLMVELMQYQQDALISLAFNCGGRTIARSTLLKLLNQNLINPAADEFLRWNKIGRAESKGLTRRRIAERNLFLTGDYA
jgi:lysozyme